MVRILNGRLRRAGLGLAVVGVLAAMGFLAAPAWSDHSRGGIMPEFTTTSKDLWVNSKPLKKADLRGKVLLLEIWTSI